MDHLINASTLLTSRVSCTVSTTVQSSEHVGAMPKQPVEFYWAGGLRIVMALDACKWTNGLLKLYQNCRYQNKERRITIHNNTGDGSRMYTVSLMSAIREIDTIENILTEKIGGDKIKFIPNDFPHLTMDTLKEA